MTVVTGELLRKGLSGCSIAETGNLHNSFPVYKGICPAVLPGCLK
jgi:hypothetical protein